MSATKRTEHPAPDPVTEDYAWQTEAACRGVDAELFFPATEDEATAAMAICETCPVRMACLAFAVERNERFGVWGGMTEKERQRLSPAARESIRRHAAA